MELQEIAATIPKKIAQRYQGSKCQSFVAEDDYMIQKILQNSVTSKMLTCLGGFFVCNNTNIKNVALFMPYAMQLLHIYQQSHAACSDSSARFQNTCDIGTYLQKWLLSEMRWIVLFVSSAVNLFFSVNDEKNLGRFKHTAGLSLSMFNKLSSSPLIDINAIMSSLKHKAWNSVDDTVKIWCSVFFSEVKARYFPVSKNVHSLTHSSSMEEPLVDAWETLLTVLTKNFFDLAKMSPSACYEDIRNNNFSSAKWFVELSSFFSLVSVQWMSKFTPNLNHLVALSGLDEVSVALLITVSTETDNRYHDIPLLGALKESSNHIAQKTLSLIVSNFGEEFCGVFRNWVKSLRLYLYALFFRFYELDRQVEKLQTLSSSRNLDKQSSLFIDRMTEVWFLVFNVSGIFVQNVLHLIFTPHSCEKMLISHMMSILYKSLELASTAVKTFDMRSQELDLLMADESDAEQARVAEGSQWLVAHVKQKVDSAQSEAPEGNQLGKGFFNLDQSFLYASAAAARPSTVLPLMQNIADIAVFLLGNMSVSSLENICLVSHICYRSAIYGVQLCTETFSLLRDSDAALCYFSAGLELPQLKAKPIGSLYLNYSTADKNQPFLSPEWQKEQKEQQHTNATLYKLPHLKKQSQVICSLDNCITEIFASISKKIFIDNANSTAGKANSKVTLASMTNIDSLDLQPVMLFPKLIDTLQFGIRSAIEDSTFRFNYLSLASPLFGLSTLMNLLQSVCSDDKAQKKDEYFWKLTNLLRQYLFAAHNLQMTINDLSDLPAVASSLPPLSDNASLVNTERGLDTLKNCDHLMKIVENITSGLGDMRLAITKQCVATETKVYLPQIRVLDYSSPVIIPNTSTDFGNYSIGFWIKIPQGYNQPPSEQQKTAPVAPGGGHSSSSSSPEETSPVSPPPLSPRSNLQANSTQKRSTHILSRVPEAGEVDMFNLFKGVPTTLCNPGIILEVLPDGTALLVVTITSTMDSAGKKSAAKKIRMVKLSSKPLPVDTWIDVSVQYTCLFEETKPNETVDDNGDAIKEEHQQQQQQQRQQQPKHDPNNNNERSILHLFIDGELHSTAEDSFGRLSLHQNIIFGTTPVSLIKPTNKNECLQAGGLRWSAQTSYVPPPPTPPTVTSSTSDHVASESTVTTNESLRPLNNSYPTESSVMITISELKPASPPLQIKMLYEPFVCVQNILKDLSDMAQFSLKIASNFFLVHIKETLLRLHASLDYASVDQKPTAKTAFNNLMSKPQNSNAEKALGYLETMITLLPSIGYRAVCLLGDCSYCDSLQESIFHFLSVNIDVLVSVKSYLETNARVLSSLAARLRTLIQVASSALQQQVSFLLSIVATLVTHDRNDTDTDRDTADSHAVKSTLEQGVRDAFNVPMRSNNPTAGSNGTGNISASSTTSFSNSGSLSGDKDMSTLLQYWLDRLHDSKHLMEEKIYPSDIISAWIVAKGYNNHKQNENGLVTNIASIIAKAVNSDLINISKIIAPVANTESSAASYNTGGVGGEFGGLGSTTSVVHGKTSLHMLLVGFFAGGGWPVSIQSNSIVDLYPRALFLHQDPKGLEHTVFPASAVVCSASPIGGPPGGGAGGQGVAGRLSGVWLHQCDGIFNRQAVSMLHHPPVGKEKDPASRVHFA